MSEDEVEMNNSQVQSEEIFYIVDLKNNMSGLCKICEQTKKVVKIKIKNSKHKADTFDLTPWGLEIKSGSLNSF